MNEVSFWPVRPPLACETALMRRSASST